MLVEPFARDRLEDNFSVVGQLYYAASSLICCAHAIAEGGKQVLGAQAGPKRLEAIFRKVGFTRFRQAAETPFNLVFRSEEHTSELQSLMRISYAVFCLKQKKTKWIR